MIRNCSSGEPVDASDVASADANPSCPSLPDSANDTGTTGVVPAPGADGSPHAVVAAPSRPSPLPHTSNGAAIGAAAVPPGFVLGADPSAGVHDAEPAPIALPQAVAGANTGKFAVFAPEPDGSAVVAVLEPDGRHDADPPPMLLPHAVTGAFGAASATRSEPLGSAPVAALEADGPQDADPAATALPQAVTGAFTGRPAATGIVACESPLVLVFEPDGLHDVELAPIALPQTVIGALTGACTSGFSCAGATGAPAESPGVAASLPVVRVPVGRMTELPVVVTGARTDAGSSVPVDGIEVGEAVDGIETGDVTGVTGVRVDRIELRSTTLSVTAIGTLAGA
jgi:hypothetical protein